MRGHTVQYKCNDQVLYKLSPAFFATPSARTFEGAREMWTYDPSTLDEKIKLSREALLSLFEIFKFLKLEGWAMPSLETKDLSFVDGVIKLARPYRLVKDPSRSLLEKMQKTLENLVSGESFTQEEKYLLDLLVGGVDPLEIENNLPMFYSVDRQIVFIFAVSSGRTALGPIYTEVNWAERISETLLAGELKRQGEFYAGNGQPNFFDPHDLMHLFIFAGNAVFSHISYFFRFVILIK